MEYKLDFDKIQKFVLDKNNKYNLERSKYVRVLPLPSRTGDRAEYKDGFSTVTAGLLRLIDGEPLEFKQNANFVDEILKAGEFDNTATEQVFREFIETELGNHKSSQGNTIQNIKYIEQPETSAELKGQRQIIELFYDIYIRNQQEDIKKIFGQLHSKGLMQDIMSISQQATTERLKEKYRVLFKQYEQLFKEDLQALSKNTGFLLENIDELFVHYTFIALTQIILQTNKLDHFSEVNLQSVPFMLQHEQASTWRFGYKEGYKRLADQVEAFFAHEHILNILALNTFTEEENLYYHDYAKILEQAGEEATNSYVQSIYEWVNTFYCVYKELQPSENYNGQDLHSAYKYLFDMVRKGLSKEHFSRFPLGYTVFIKRFYRKNGGQLGTILALSLKQLLLLVAVSVGEKQRIELNELWHQLALRGVELDDPSKIAAVEILDKLNYIDKKSDSGDAQYVKSIL